MEEGIEVPYHGLGGGPFGVLGAGVSGRAVADLLRRRNLACTVYDEAGAGGARTAFNPAECAAFVLSPGFAAEHPWRVAAEASGKPCYGETGFAAGLWRGPVIGVTGTNGKTTVTRLLASALTAAGHSARAAGNIGVPLSLLVDTADNDGRTIAVCETSSFQAELPLGLRLDGLLWTNFDEDHLDRYTEMEDYFRAKAGLLGCLRPGAPVLVGASVAGWAERTGVPLPAGVRIVEERGGGLSGPEPFATGFQAANYALVRQWFLVSGLPEDPLARAAAAFEASPHRLHRFAEADGLECWDDSKATNFHAARAALDALDGRIHWLGGGSGKGGDLTAFGREVAGRVAGAWLYGKAALELAPVMREAGCRVEAFERFGDAVSAAFDAAQADRPCHLLLSPGFASFDQFSSYAERGESFVSMVLGLMGDSAGTYS